MHKLVVCQTRPEIDGQATTVMFDVPTPLRETFAWRPGQHITLALELDGEEVRRSYSISSSPFSGDPLRITVKRVEGGLVSNYINDSIGAGDELFVMPPFGGFCLDPGDRLRRTHYFFGAGSGITPLYSMLHSVLCSEPYSTTHLVYGNTNAKSIIFRDELDGLLAAHPDRITVSHVLSEPSMLSRFRPWRTGKIDRAMIEAVVVAHPPYAQDAQYYICGPGSMNSTVRQDLMSLDVPANRIHRESFGAAHADADDSVKGVKAVAHITLDGQEESVPIDAGQTILAAARRAGMTPPYSCESGVCGACRARLVSGNVHMRARMALEDGEITRGAVLTCQSVATSPTVTVEYQ